MNSARVAPAKNTVPDPVCSRVMMPGLLKRVSAIAKRRIEYLLIPLALLLFLGLWSLIVRLGNYPPFILPSPLRVYGKFLTVVGDGTLWRHIRITLVEIFWGLALGLSLAISLGYLLAKSSHTHHCPGPSPGHLVRLRQSLQDLDLRAGGLFSYPDQHHRRHPCRRGGPG
jgi:hypothetical protein